MIFLYFIIVYLFIAIGFYLMYIYLVKTVADGDAEELLLHYIRMGLLSEKDASDGKPESLSISDYVWLCLLIASLLWPWTIIALISSHISN